MRGSLAAEASAPTTQRLEQHLHVESESQEIEARMTAEQEEAAQPDAELLDYETYNQASETDVRPAVRSEDAEGTDFDYYLLLGECNDGAGLSDGSEPRPHDSLEGGDSDDDAKSSDTEAPPDDDLEVKDIPATQLTSPL